MTLQDLPEYLTIKEASDFMNVHPNTLRNWEKEGKIFAVRIGPRRDRRFSRDYIWQMYHPAEQTVLSQTQV